MATSVPDIDRLRPAGTKRSGKREQIVNVFLRQEGHLSADDLVDLIRREDQRISRATVRSEEHTSELQSRLHLVCRLLLEKKKKNKSTLPALQNSHVRTHPTTIH